jgi:hypothetical protein
MKKMTNADVMASYFSNGYIPASDIMYMVVIVAVAAIALWQARVFVAKF